VIEKLEAGGDPREDWRTINEIIDVLNTFEKMSIIPADAGRLRIGADKFVLDLNGLVTKRQARDNGLVV
jgi:hypothetical protein